MPNYIAFDARQFAVLRRFLTDPACPLDATELAILQGFADGRRAHEIAADPGMTYRRLKRRLVDIRTKMGAASRLDAVVSAWQRGWIE